MKAAVVGLAMSVGLVAVGPASAGTSAGRPFSWGVDRWGALGDAEAIDSALSARPLQVDGLSGLVATDAGEDSATYGVDGDGAVVRWTPDGQLNSLPGPPAGASDIAAGRGFVVMSDHDGRLWTSDSSRGRSSGGRPRQLSMPRGVSAVDVSAQGSLTMAVGNDGAVYRWPSARSRMRRGMAGVPATMQVAEIDLGLGVGVLRTAQGDAYTWGDALARTGERSSTPRRLDLPAGVSATAVVAGDRFVAVLGSNGAVFTVGRDDRGQRGDGPGTSDADVVSTVVLPEGVKAERVLASGETALVVTNDAMTYRWGLLGLSHGEKDHPLVAATPVLLATDGAPVDLAFAGEVLVLVDEDANVSAVGPLSRLTRRTQPTEVRIPGESTVRQISIDAHVLAIGGSGELYVWGSNRFGQLGLGIDPPATAQPRRLTLPNGDRPASIAAGQRFSVVSTVDGSLYSWGVNQSGQLGIGRVGGREWTPVGVELALGVSAVAVAAGRVHAAAIGSDARVYVWGCCGPVLGRGESPTTTTRPMPVELPPGLVPSDVVAGDGFTAVRTTTGEVVAWGHGVGSSPRRLDIPPVSQLAAGGHQLLVTTMDGALIGLGSSGFGRPEGAVHADEAEDDLSPREAGLEPVPGPEANGRIGLEVAGTFGLNAASDDSGRRPRLPVGVTASEIAAGRGWAVILGSDRRVYQWRGAKLRVLPGTEDLVIADVAAGAGVGYLLVAPSGEVSEPEAWVVVTGLAGLVSIAVVRRRRRPLAV